MLEYNKTTRRLINLEPTKSSKRGHACIIVETDDDEIFKWLEGWIRRSTRYPNRTITQLEMPPEKPDAG